MTGRGEGVRGREINLANWRGNLKERVHLKNSGVDVRIILKRVLKKYCAAWGLDLFGSRQGHISG